MTPFGWFLITCVYLWGMWKTWCRMQSEPAPPGEEKPARAADAVIALIWPLFWGIQIGRALLPNGW